MSLLKRKNQNRSNNIHVGFIKLLTIFAFIIATPQLFGISQWNRTSFPANTAAYCIKQYNGKMLAGASNGIYESLDSGDTWNKLTLPTGDTAITSLEINPNGDYFAGGSFKGILKSTNGGQSWKIIKEGLYVTWGLLDPPNKEYVKVYPIISAGQAKMYAGSPTWVTDWGHVFVSSNYGETWAKGQLGDIMEIITVDEFAKDSNGNIYAACATSGLYKRTASSNWQRVFYDIASHVAVNYKSQVFISMPTSPPNIFYSTDYGATWKSSNAYKFNHPNCFLFDQDNIDDIWVGAYDDGVYHYNGSAWIKKDAGIENENVLSLSFTIDKFLLAGTIHGIFKAGGDVVPVELTNFRATNNDGKIILKWKTMAESNNYGFEIEKKCAELKSPNWQKIGFVKGNSTTNKETKYVFEYFEGECTNIKYRLKQIDFDGAFSYSDEIILNNVLPANFGIHNYPNPFNSSTIFSVELPRKTDFKLGIYDVRGRLMDSLFEGEKDAGFYTFRWRPENFPTGIYLCRFQSASLSKLIKVIYVR